MHLSVTALFAGLFAVISCNANALVTVNTSSGCKLKLRDQWPPTVKARWVGACNNGFASGTGKLILSAPEAPTIENSGTMDTGIKIGDWVEKRLTADPKTRAVYVYSVTVTYIGGEPSEENLRQVPQDAPAHIVNGLRREYADNNNQSNSNPAVASAGGNQASSPKVPSSSATNSGGISSANCPDEASSEYAIFKYLGNGRFACANKINRIFGDCMTAANVDIWFKGSPMGLEAHEQRSVVAWAHCKLDNDRNWNAKGTQAQVNVGNASEVNGRKEGGKSAWKRGDFQASQSQSQQESDAGAQGSNGSPKSKYVSKDATHCVEMVPKGFKCDGPYDRFLTNICMTKISVRWRLGSDPWGMQELAPKGCTPVSPFRDQRGVQFKACSWDPKASHGPYSDPCRY